MPRATMSSSSRFLLGVVGITAANIVRAALFRRNPEREFSAWKKKVKLLFGGLVEGLDAAHAAFDRAQLDDLGLLGGGPQFLELAGRGEDAAVERGDGGVVAVQRRAQALAQAVQVLGHHAEALVKLLAELADLARVVGDALLPPA